MKRTMIGFGLVALGALAVGGCGGALSSSGLDLGQLAYGGQRIKVQNAMSIPLCGVDEVVQGDSTKAHLSAGPNQRGLQPGAIGNAYLPKPKSSSAMMDLRFRGCDVSGVPTSVVATVAKVSAADLEKYDDAERPLTVH